MKPTNIIIALVIIVVVIGGGAYYAGVFSPEAEPVEEVEEATEPVTN